MKKFIAVVCAGMALTAAAFAVEFVTPNLDKGTQELRLAGSLNTDVPLDYDLSVGAAYGFFVIDELEVAGVVDYSGNDLSTHMDIGVIGEYFFDLNSVFMPFLGAGVGYSVVELDDAVYNDAGDADFDSVTLKAVAGVAYFLRDSVAIELRLVGNYAAEDLYVDQDGDFSDTSLATNIGLRFFWD